MLKRLRRAFKHRWLPYIIAYTAKHSLRLILRTCRLEVHGLADFVATAQTSPCIVMLWHNTLPAIPEILYKFAPQFTYTAFISKSRDGEPLALLTESYKIGRALRVPHNARHHALNTMIHHLKNRREVMIITPDGPRGPRYVMKPGISLAAREAAAKIVPFSWQSDRCWILNTWDQMRIPKPFSKLKITFGTPITLPPGENISQDITLLTTALKILA